MEILYPHLQLISDFGNNFTVLLGVTCALGVYYVYKKHSGYILTLLAALLAYPYSIVLKNIFKMPRPPLTNLDLYTKLDTYSFPSSHVVSYVVFFGTIYYLSTKVQKGSKLVKYVLQAFSVYMILSVGLSRVVLGVHWVKDVVGGYIFGVFFLLLLLYCEKKITRLVIQKRSKALTKN